MARTAFIKRPIGMVRSAIASMLFAPDSFGFVLEPVIRRSETHGLYP
jgi:hypothetical protein